MSKSDTTPGPLTSFTYSGPLSGVTLDNGQEVLLMPGAEVRLPPDHEYTRTLIARKHLAPVPEAKKATTGKTPTPTTGS